MTTNRVARLAGMRDVTGEEYESLARVAARVRSFFSRKGYASVDTPLMEDADLFVRKAGGELISRMYTFTDPGGRRVSLRPEFTSSVIRYYVQERMALAAPARLQYGGPVFRYERGVDAGYRQFSQAGAELIGADGLDADVEIISLAFVALQEAGLRGYVMRVGHVAVLQSFLSALGLSEPAKLFVIGNASELSAGGANVAGLMEQAQLVGLLGSGVGRSEYASLGDSGQEATRDFIQGVLTVAVSGPVGRRTTDEIVERLLRKVQHGDRPETLEKALRLAGELAGLQGEPSDVLRRARDVAARHGVGAASLEELRELFAALAGGGLEGAGLELDLGLARGLSYYTGVVFDVVYPADGRMIALGGGGRYDAMVKALGGEDAPALGFAYTLERVVEAGRLQGGVDPAGVSAATSPAV